MKTFPVLMAVFVLLFVGCADKTADELGPEREAVSLEPIAFTVYSDKTELFVEFKPLVVGSKSNFAAHFTTLGENFLPLTEGKVSVSLIVGESGIRNSADAASSPGIFRLALIPKAAGVGKLVFDIETKDYSDQIIIENSVVYPDEQTALAEQTETADAGEISYLKEQSWKVEFANIEAKVKPFSEVLKTSGQILAAPGDETILASQISGIVSFSRKNMVAGIAVGAGATLFTVKSNDVVQSNLGAAVRQAENNLEAAKKNFERASELVKDKIISEKEFLEARLRLENAQSQLTDLAVSKNFNQNRQSVAAPNTGFLKNIMVENGAYVQVGQALATISKNKRILLRVDISRKYFPKMTSYTAANFKTAYGSEVFSTRDLSGRIISTGKSVDAGSPFLPIHFEIDNTGNLIPGSMVEVFLLSDTKPALIIPTMALLEEQGNFYVFVQLGGESFQKREIKIGASDGENVQVLSGIEEGERVVTKGAYQIKLSSASGELPAHGHEH